MSTAIHARNGRVGPAWCGAGRFVQLVSILTHRVTCKNCLRMLRARGFYE